MNFLLLNNTWTATFFLTLMKTKELYYLCSVRVEKEDIQIIEKTIESVWKNVSRHWPDFPIYQWWDTWIRYRAYAMNRYALTIALMHDIIVYLNALLNVFCECMHISYWMEIIILTIEMLQLLLIHGFENISRVVRHFNRKVAIQVVTWALTTWKFCSWK
jgi:hypothetical protein